MAQSKVLIIDDEEILRDILIEVMNMNGIETLSAETGEQGVELYKDNQEEIGAVLLDMILPGNSGVQIFREIEKINPAATVIFMSGIGQKEEIESLNTFAEISFVKKPFSLDEIKLKVMKYFPKH